MSESAEQNGAGVAQRKSRLGLIALFVLFSAPVLVAWLLWSQADQLGLGTSNRGELITPARPLDPFTLPLRGGDDSLSLEQLRGKWSLVYHSEKGCDERCRDNLYHMRQVHILMHKNADRVQRLWLASGSSEADAGIGEWISEYPDLLIAHAKEAELKVLVDQLMVPSKIASEFQPGIFVVDPLGNLMMVYDQGAAAEDLLKDLKKLLKISKIG